MSKPLSLPVRNILATYYLATAQETEYGMDWYMIASNIATRISAGTGVDKSTVAAVISALSPSNKWEKNILDAEALIQVYLANGSMDDVKVSTYGQNKSKAWRLLKGSDPEKEFGNAPKTYAFWKLIADWMDHQNAVVVDGHAKNIWGGERMALKKTKSMTKNQYNAVAEDYRIAAEQVGIFPHQMQAITWVAHRRVHGVA